MEQLVNMNKIRQYINCLVVVKIYDERNDNYIVRIGELTGLEPNGIYLKDDSHLDQSSKHIFFITKNSAIATIELKNPTPDNVKIYTNDNLPMFAPFRYNNWHGLNEPLEISIAIYLQFGESSAFKYLEQLEADCFMSIDKCKNRNLFSEKEKALNEKINDLNTFASKKNDDHTITIGVYHESCGIIENIVQIQEATIEGIKYYDLDNISGHEPFISNGRGIYYIRPYNGHHLTLFANPYIALLAYNSNGKGLNTKPDIAYAMAELFGYNYAYNNIKNYFDDLFEKLQCYIDANPMIKDKMYII